MTSLQNTLNKHGACSEAVEWCEDQTPYHAWRSCERGDWLLWICMTLGVERKCVVLAACACARTTLQYLAEDESRPRLAIETAEAWTRGEATIDEVYAAANAADAAADAAGPAAYAAADAAGAAAYAAAAKQRALRNHARLVRKLIPYRTIRALLNGASDE